MSYAATFVGGVLDGEVVDVASVAPGRIVYHHGLLVPVAWSGKPMPRRPYDVYENREHDSGGDGTCTYHYVRTVT